MPVTSSITNPSIADIGQRAHGCAGLVATSLGHLRTHRESSLPSRTANHALRSHCGPWKAQRRALLAGLATLRASALIGARKLIAAVERNTLKRRAVGLRPLVSERASPGHILFAFRRIERSFSSICIRAIGDSAEEMRRFATRGESDPP
jgi:hypothetical protein